MIWNILGRELIKDIIMDRSFSLIKTGYQDVEKRVFPRFPFTYLTFKGTESDAKVFEVKDISFTGMQLCLKDGGHGYQEGNDLSGSLHWRNACLDINGIVQWVSGQRIGIRFSEDKKLNENLQEFLSIDNILSRMRPVEQGVLGLELPANLKCWLQADGPVEVFVWQHSDGEISKFQILMMESFIEYQDGKGLKTGRVMTKRDMDTPLMTEDEFVFEMDEGLDMNKLQFAKDIVEALPNEYLSNSVEEFLRLKLGMS